MTKIRKQKIAAYMLKSALIGTASFLLCNSANAATQILTMTLGGNIYPTPAWQVNGSTSSTAAYTFSAFGTGTITSGSVNLLVINPSTLGGTSIALTLPTGCKVGATAPATVEFRNTTTGSITSTNTNLLPTDVTSLTTITDATNITFTGVTTSGAVTCTTGGSLTYTY